MSNCMDQIGQILFDHIYLHKFKFSFWSSYGNLEIGVEHFILRCFFFGGLRRAIPCVWHGWGGWSKWGSSLGSDRMGFGDLV